jgi:hypothetical protein
MTPGGVCENVTAVQGARNGRVMMHALARQQVPAYCTPLRQILLLISSKMRSKNKLKTITIAKHIYSACCESALENGIKSSLTVYAQHNLQNVRR